MSKPKPPPPPRCPGNTIWAPWMPREYPESLYYAWADLPWFIRWREWPDGEPRLLGRVLP